MGISILFEVAVVLERYDAQDLLKAAYRDEVIDESHGFNLSPMVFLAKVASGEDPELGNYFKSGEADRSPSPVATTV